MEKLSQRSRDYSGLKINGTTSSVYNYGCLVVALAMASGHTVKQVLVRIGFNGDQVNWTGLDKIGLEKYKSTSYHDTAAKKAIKDNGFVIARVDWDGNQKTKKDTHFVLMIGNGKIIDPIDGKEKSSGAYKIYTGLRFIKKIGIKPEENMSEIFLGQDLGNKEAMKVCVKLWHDVMIKGKYNDYKSPEAFHEAVEELKASHRKQISDNKSLHEKDLENFQLKMDRTHKAEIVKLNSQIKDRDLRISDLKKDLLNKGNNPKARFTSRKFLMVAIATLVPAIIALGSMFGLEIDTPTLTAALTGLGTFVLMFVAPEAYTDYKERIELAK